MTSPKIYCLSWQQAQVTKIHCNDMESQTKEIRRLQYCINDLVGLLALQKAFDEIKTLKDQLYKMKKLGITLPQ